MPRWDKSVREMDCSLENQEESCPAQSKHESKGRSERHLVWLTDWLDSIHSCRLFCWRRLGHDDHRLEYSSWLRTSTWKSHYKIKISCRTRSACLAPGLPVLEKDRMYFKTGSPSRTVTSKKCSTSWPTSTNLRETSVLWSGNSMSMPLKKNPISILSWMSVILETVVEGKTRDQNSPPTDHVSNKNVNEEVPNPYRT